MLFQGNPDDIIPDIYTDSVFGKYKIIGKLKDTNNHVVYCEECANDPELFGKGLFTTLLNDFKSGQIPCGCSPRRKWTESQQLVRARRLAEVGGFTFLGWEGPYKRGKTYCRFECKVHGIWTTTTVNGAFKTKSGCPQCYLDRIGKYNLQPEIETVSKFFKTGSYHVNTEFTRSDRVNNKGYKDYWKVYCPVCNTVNESSTYGLTVGKLPCECSVHSQKQLYLNCIYSDTSLMAIKFGIARRSLVRLSQQIHASGLQVENFGIWEFKTVRDCKDTEKYLKMNFPRRFLTKEDFPDGYTETVDPLYLEDMVVKIAAMGGKLISNTKPQTSLLDSATSFISDLF